MQGNSLKFTIRAKRRLLDLSAPKIMGVLNLTADSFFDGGRYDEFSKATIQAQKLWEEGADILDVGAYSSRPGAHEIGIQQEIDSLLPVISWIQTHIPEAVISVDTFRSRVASEAVAAGAHIVNDISGGTLDEDMISVVGRLKVPYILMHMRGTPENMQELTQYDDIMFEMMAYFRDKIATLRQAGVADIILDPGLGFAKTLSQNYEVLRRLNEFAVLEIPMLGAISRKSMIYKALDISPQEALNGTTVLNTVLLMKGVQLLRVHDVRAAKEAIQLLSYL